MSLLKRADKMIALRVLGSEGQSVLSVEDVISRLAIEARAPDMR